MTDAQLPPWSLPALRAVLNGNGMDIDAEIAAGVFPTPDDAVDSEPYWHKQTIDAFVQAWCRAGLDAVTRSAAHASPAHAAAVRAEVEVARRRLDLWAAGVDPDTLPADQPDAAEGNDRED